ncbi:MAG TPA: glycosyltransferase family 2 protein [Candidatus Woesebacteria bacterium]|nr:glycosyltransferase family 2 protein [Candidatus Woesebacteria bacterium]
MKQSISILVPVYKGSHVLPNALVSLAKQTNRNFEIIIGDDNKPEDIVESDKTLKVIENFHAKLVELDIKINIRYIKNKTNLGCHKNFENLVKEANTDIVLFLAQDDIFSVDAVEKVMNAFEEFPEAAFVTRPYFWFEDDFKKPIRYVPPLNAKKNVLMRLKDGEKTVTGVFGSVGQISGLAIRKNLIRIPYHTDIFPGHIYPLADLLKEYPAIFINDYILAVGTFDSQSRHISAIYDDSPTEQWMRMFNTIYSEKKYEAFLKLCIKHMATNYEGLIQIKNFGKPGKAEREILILLKYRWQNIFAPRFWLYSILTLVMPRSVLRKITDYYKRTVLSKRIPNIPFNY